MHVHVFHFAAAAGSVNILDRICDAGHKGQTLNEVSTHECRRMSPTQGTVALWQDSNGSESPGVFFISYAEMVCFRNCNERDAQWVQI